MEGPTEAGCDGFLIDDEGVYYSTENETIEVCSPLVLEAITRNQDGNDWGKLFRLVDPEGSVKQYHMRSSLLVANQQVVMADLVNKGLEVSGHPKAKLLLMQYLRSVKVKASILSTAKPGWINGSFVLPDESFGSEKAIYSGNFRDHGFGVAGDWKGNVGKLCSGNPLLVFAASTAFAAPMLAVAEMEGGGFHFRGASSMGKSTALEVAASVCGSAANYVLNWDTTKNSLEEVAETHNDCLMVIDELGIVGPGDHRTDALHDCQRPRQSQNGTSEETLACPLLDQRRGFVSRTHGRSWTGTEEGPRSSSARHRRRRRCRDGSVREVALV
ncbi:MAG: DUF927 domain-containing protein [Ignavibacteriota bacterium]